MVVTSIYGLVDSPLKKKKNEKAWTLNPDKLDAVRRALDIKIQAIKPTLIVTSCPAILGVLTNANPATAKIESTRGSVYEYAGIPAVVTYPISAINRNKSDQDSLGVEGVSSYSVKSGDWILMQDWGKVSRIFCDATRRIPDFDYSVIRDVRDIASVERYLDSCTVIASDIETVGSKFPKIRYTMSCVGYCGLGSDGRVKAFVFPLYDKFVTGGCYWSDGDMILVLEAIKRINANKAIKAFQNGSYDQAYFIQAHMPANNWLMDSYHMWHAMYQEIPKRLDFITSILQDEYQYWKADIKGLEDKDETKRDTDMETYWRYNALDCYWTLFDCLFLWALLRVDKKAGFNYKKEFMQQMAGFTMGMKGIKADKQKLFEMGENLLVEKEEALKHLLYIMGEKDEQGKTIPGHTEFNPNSPVQKTTFLYDVLGATERDDSGKVVGPKSKKKRSSGANALKMLKWEHPLFKTYVDALTDTLAPSKRISDFIEIKMATNRFRTSFNAAGTQTWRFASKGSPFWDGRNSQNIPGELKDWMIADEGCLLFDADFRQSDGYFVAFESNDTAYIKTMTSGKDSHAVHCSHFFEREYEYIVEGKKRGSPEIIDPVTGIRQITKKIVHGGNYQMYAGTLFVQMGRDMVIATAIAMGFNDAGSWTDKQLINLCARLLGSHRGLYPRLSKHEWYADINRMLETTQCITNAFGMTHRYMGDITDNATQREATAFLGQGGTAGNMNRVLDEIILGYIPPKFRDGLNPHAKEKPLKLDYPGSSLGINLQVHDSFVGNVNMRADDCLENINNLLTVMERPIIINGHRMHVPADIDFGLRYGKTMIPWDRKDPHALTRISLQHSS
jgi:hypothetical protein